MEKFTLSGKKDDELFKIFLPVAKHYKPPMDEPDLPAPSTNEKTHKEITELISKLKAISIKSESMFP